MHKCGDCAVIQVKVRSEKKAEIKCCPNLDWECQKYRIGKKTRTSHDLLTVILDGKKMTSENFVEILVSMNITGASRNDAIKSLQQNTSPVDALMNLTGSKWVLSYFYINSIHYIFTKRKSAYLFSFSECWYERLFNKIFEQYRRSLLRGVRHISSRFRLFKKKWQLVITAL